MTTDLTQFAVGKLNQIFEAANKAIPKATALAVQVTWWDCFQNIMFGFLLLFFCIVLASVGFWAFKKFQVPVTKKYRSGGTYSEKDECWFIVIIPTAVLSFLSLLTSLHYLIDGWAWIGLFHPDLYLVHEILKRV